MRGRPREFDRATALTAAMEVFWEKGFQATSIDDLVARMGIGRQSLYNAFGDKEALMCAAIEHYQQTALQPLVEALEAPGSPRANLTRVLHKIAERFTDGQSRGCLLVNSAIEFAGADRTSPVLSAVQAGFKIVERTFRKTLARAVEAGELPANYLVAEQATFFAGAMQGMLLMAKTGATRAALKRVADGALSTLDR